jgi:Na+(H+)/acetate symporter ActP
MKATTWTVIILAVIIAAIGIASSIISSKVSRDFTQDLTTAEESIRKENWEEAQKAVKAMKNEWENTCQWLQFWVNHDDTDDVSLSIEQLTAAIEVKDVHMSLIISAELGESLRHIYHRDALRFSNIL